MIPCAGKAYCDKCHEVITVGEESMIKDTGIYHVQCFQDHIRDAKRSERNRQLRELFTSSAVGLGLKVVPHRKAG